VQMHLLIHPDWLKGAPNQDENGNEYGGWAGAPADATAGWFNKRLENLKLIEVRGEELPASLQSGDGKELPVHISTAPQQAQFTCSSCGRQQDVLEGVEASRHNAPIASYALLCSCPECLAAGHSYGGRFFKAPDQADVKCLSRAIQEWELFCDSQLAGYWPTAEIAHSMRTHVKDPLPRHGYTHWWKLFNERQLLGHAYLLRAFTEQTASWPLDVRESALGAFHQYLRNQNMFCFYHVKRDCLAPFLSNANYNPKNRAIEVGIFSDGYGPWKSTSAATIAGMEWANDPWEAYLLPENTTTVSRREAIGDAIPSGTASLICDSSTALDDIDDSSHDLVITDPPFGNNLFYADLADFFYVWLRIPLLKWYEGLPERKYFEPERTPHAVEAIDNSVEHPDDREPWECSPLVEAKHLQKIRKLTGDETIAGPSQSGTATRCIVPSRRRSSTATR